MDIPKIFIPENEKILEERIQYLLKEPKLEPTELLKINGKLYALLTHPHSTRKAIMDINLNDYLNDVPFFGKLVEYECYEKTKA